MGWSVALDFGTTATAAAVRGDGGPVAALMLPDGGSTVSSSVFIDAEQVLVGAEADNAAEMYLAAYEPTPKRAVGQERVVLGGMGFAPAVLIGAVLAPVLAEAVRQHDEEPPAAVTLTHPVSWRATRRRVLSEALTNAAVRLGVQLPDPVLVAEPIAAAQWYAQQDPPDEGQCFAVYDLGGGTFDATVLRRTDTGFEPIGKGSIDPLGGFDFDQLLLNFLGERYIAAADAGLWRELSDPQQADPGLARQRRQLQQRVRLLKVALTTETSKPVRLPGLADQKVVTRTEYEALIADKIDATVTELADTIEEAGLAPDELTAVYRIGGAARTPLVGVALQQLQLPIKVHDHPKLVVAQGAAVSTDQHSSIDEAPPPPPAAAVNRSRQLFEAAVADRDGGEHAAALAGFQHVVALDDPHWAPLARTQLDELNYAATQTKPRPLTTTTVSPATKPTAPPDKPAPSRTPSKDRLKPADADPGRRAPNAGRASIVDDQSPESIRLKAPGALITSVAVINFGALIATLAIWLYTYSGDLNLYSFRHMISKMAYFYFPGYGSHIEKLIVGVALGLAAKHLWRVPRARPAAVTGLVGAIVALASAALLGTLLNIVVQLALAAFGSASLALHRRWSTWTVAAGALGVVAAFGPAEGGPAYMSIIFAITFLAWSTTMLRAGILMNKDNLVLADLD